MSDSPIRAITFDAYNTLFDFATGSPAAVRRIFSDLGVEADGDAYLRALAIMNDTVMGRLGAFVNASRAEFDGFIRMHDIHTEMFTHIERDLIDGIDVSVATDAWNRYVAQVPLYDDARDAVEWAARNWPVAIVSDIDTWMLTENPHLEGLPLAGVITSEDHASYKAMSDTTMFHSAAELLGCAPSELLHVGDSGADVIGVKRFGGRAVWLDRFGHALEEAVPEPDATITTLADLPDAVERLNGSR